MCYVLFSVHSTLNRKFCCSLLLKLSWFLCSPVLLLVFAYYIKICIALGWAAAAFFFCCCLYFIFLFSLDMWYIRSPFVSYRTQCCRSWYSSMFISAPVMTLWLFFLPSHLFMSTAIVVFYLSCHMCFYSLLQFVLFLFAVPLLLFGWCFFFPSFCMCQLLISVSNILPVTKLHSLPPLPPISNRISFNFAIANKHCISTRNNTIYLIPYILCNSSHSLELLSI